MIKLELTPIEAVVAAGSLVASVENSRKFCRDTDAKYGKMNDIVREQMQAKISAHKTILISLREAGWPMEGQDIQPRDGDTETGGYGSAQ